MKLLALFFLFINLIVKVLAVDEPKDEKFRQTFDEIFGKGWDEDDLEEIKVETTPFNPNLWAWNLTKKKRTERTEIQTVQTLTEQAEDDQNINQNVEAYNSDSTDQNITRENPANDYIDQNVEAYNSDSIDQNLIQKDPANVNIDQNVEAYNSDSTNQNLTQGDPDYIDQSNNEDETIEGFIDKNEFKEKKKFSEQEKQEIISKFHSMREEYKKQGKVTEKERYKKEQNISRKLGVSRKKIYKWKKEFGLIRKIKINKKSFYEKKKREFIDRIKEIKMSTYGEQTKLIKDLGISKNTICCWKKEFGLPVNCKSEIIYKNIKFNLAQIIYSDSEKLELMKTYYKIKQRNPKISDLAIANFLNIGSATLKRWKKQFANSVDEHYSLPENGSPVKHNDSSEHPMPSHTP